MKITPATDAGYQLLHDGAIVFAQLEANGVKVDLQYMERTSADLKGRIIRLTDHLKGHPTWAVWRRRFGGTALLGNREQLGIVLFDELKFPGGTRTQEDEGQYSTDEAVLNAFDDQFVRGYVKLEKLKKGLTYLKGIAREVDPAGFIHPVFKLHTTLTYRSSASDPPFHQYPVRNPEIGQLVRQCFTARDRDHVLVENDFKGVEVTTAACYHLDPTMLEYVKDESKDMHRDMARQLYCLTPEEWAVMVKLKYAKAARHAAKNKFVFPQFYGDWFKSCAEVLWEEIDHASIKGPDGRSMREHLKAVGMKGLGTFDPERDREPTKGSFMAHVKAVEHDFWYQRFPVYTQWKKDWYNDYLQKGWFTSHTGFLYQGLMRKNEVINYAVQGSAFHCLLWSLVRLQRELTRRRLRTKLIGQIHDSILADVYIPELDEYLALVRQITEVDILQAWPWLVSPLTIECEISPWGMTWHDKREVKIHRGPGTYGWNDFNGSAQDLLKFWQGKGKL